MKIVESKRLDKNARIRATRVATKQRRSTKSCKTYTCKLDKSHFSTEKSDFLRNLFLEAKWFVNDIIRDKNIFDYDYKTKLVAVMNKNQEWEVRRLKVLPSQIRQELHNCIKGDIIKLSKLKKATGKRVGRLKFKKIIRTIPLNQFGCTFKIINAKYITIQGMRKPFKASGLNQIPQDAEIATAKLIHHNGNYYINVICFVDKDVHQKTGKRVGLDFGCTTTVTTSDGDKYNIKVPETKRLKKLRRGFNTRKKKGSKNRAKRNDKIKKELEHINNQKKDQRNKLVKNLTTKYDVICCQDESIAGWQSGGHGKAVQQSCMKGIISDLKTKSETFVLVNKWFPSTKTCNKCYTVRENVHLYERVFTCPVCGHTQDRDVHSADNMLQEGLIKLGLVAPRLIRSVEDVKSPVESTTSVQNAFSGFEQVIDNESGSPVFNTGQFTNYCNV
jgi:putative transposase